MTSPVAGPTPKPLHEAPRPRVSTGVSGLDALIEGGLPPRRAVVVSGRTGTGKTTLALQFIVAGLARGEPGVLVITDQKPAHLIQDAARFGWPVADSVERGLLAILDAAPFFTAARKGEAVDARRVASDLLAPVRRLGAARLAVDSLTSLLPGEQALGRQDFLRALMFSLEDNLGCTTLLTAWTGAGAGAAQAAVFATGLIELRLRPRAEGPLRTLAVRKMRGTRAVVARRRFEIVDGQGLVVRDRG